MKNRFFYAQLAIIACVLSLISCKATSTGQEVKTVDPKVKNIIYMIGDGMGLTQITALAEKNDFKPLNLERAEYIGLAKTYSKSHKVTDSAASGTALATGSKTYNGAIGVDIDKKPLESILKKSVKKGLRTGLIATHAIVDATPAAFIANVEHRDMKYDIAADFLKTDIDLFIGGGREFFNQREDGRDLMNELSQKGFHVATTLDDVLNSKNTKIAGLLSEGDMPSMLEGRGDYLPQVTEKALNVLNDNNDKGFFIMVEGSMIDRGGHKNNYDMVVTETEDFDNAIRVAFDFADKNPGTLVVVTADHETGGLTLKKSKENIKPEFSTGGHTATYVPIYAYGTGAKEFSTFMENKDIPMIMSKQLSLN
ncbi:MAG: alkaline phosphatase [Bacteroides sp.]|nr:alkaline phosphatase [Bacteroides sp.]